MSERGDINYAIGKTGLTKRTVQSLAARGKIPGAAKLGGKWTFDKIKLGRWIKAKEAECLTTSTRETGSGMPAFRWRGATSGNPYTLEIAARRKCA